VPKPEFALAPQLQAQLRAVHPGSPIEVCNLGITAINSHAIVEIARQAVEFEPDLLVVYMGNNEVVGPFGASSVVTGGTPPRVLIRAGLRLRETRTGQLLQRVFGALRPAGGGFREWGGMEMFAGRTISADDPRLDAVRANFAANLDEILALAREHGIKTVLATVAVNVRDSAPFASFPAIFSDTFAATDLAAALDRIDGARRLLEQAVAAEPGNAEAHFRLARVLDEQGDTAAARPHYFAALEGDALRFRADAHLNDLIRRAARSAGDSVSLVDVARELGSDAASTAELADHHLFFEHVHLTWEGNYALARLLAARAAAVLWGLDPVLAPWLDDASCAAAVGFTVFGRLAQLMTMDELTGRPPFTGQCLYAADRTRLEREVRTANSALVSAAAIRGAVETVDRAIARDPDNPALLFQAAAVRMQTGDIHGAIGMADRLARLAPPSGEQAAQRAFLLKQLGRGDEAVDVLLRSAETEPYYFQTYSLLAQIWLANGQEARAVEHFAVLSERMPGSRVVRSSYAQLLARTGDWAGAEREWNGMLERTPDDETALDPLVNRMAETGRLEAAIVLMQRAFACNPRSHANNARLVQVFSHRSDADLTVKYMRALAASGPVNAVLYADLAVLLQSLDRREEMRAALFEARRIARLENDADTLRAAEALLRETGG